MTFQVNRIDAQILPCLTNDELKDLGISAPRRPDHDGPESAIVGRGGEDLGETGVKLGKGEVSGHGGLRGARFAGSLMGRRAMFQLEFEHRRHELRGKSRATRFSLIQIVSCLACAKGHI